MASIETIPASKPAETANGISLMRRACSFPVFLGALLVAAVFITTATMYEGTGARLFTEGDTWWHAAVGQQILRTHQFPVADTYSFTVSGNSWIAYEWLGEIVMGVAAGLGGLRGLAILLLILASLFFVSLYIYSWQRCGNAKAAFVACSVLLPLASEFFTLRPQLIGYIFLLVTLICLERFRQGKTRAIWLLPGLFLVWVNTHGTFVIGLFVLGLYWASGWVSFRWGGLAAEPWTAEQRRKLALVALLCVLVLPITPYGTQVAAYPLDMAVSQPVNLANIYEWMPMPLDLLMGKTFLLLVLGLVAAQLILRPTYRLEEFSLLLLVIYASSVHRRFGFLFVAVFTPVLATILGRWLKPPDAKTDRYGLNAALIAMIAAILFALLPAQPNLENVVARKFPQGAVAFLRQNSTPSSMLNEYGWGGYLIWALSPAHKVFIDGRTDIYEHAGVFPDYLSMTRLEPDTLSLLRKYKIEACLLERSAPLGTFLSALPDWSRAYEDKVSILFVHHAGAAPPSGGHDAKPLDSPRQQAMSASRVARIE